MRKRLIILLKKAMTTRWGARPLARKIDELIRVPLSKKILFEQIKDSNIMCVMDEDTGKIDFAVTQKGKASVGEDGIIEVGPIDPNQLP